MLLGDATAVESFRGVPVIVIGGEDSDAIDRVRAFARGCDDFVARPFVYDELVARINAVLRRARPRRARPLEAGAIWIEHSTRRVNVGGVRVDLAAKEYELLLKLASDPQRVFTKEELLREVWGFGRWAGRDAGLARVAAAPQAAGRRSGPVRDQRVARRATGCWIDCESRRWTPPRISSTRSRSPTTRTR